MRRNLRLVNRRDRNADVKTVRDLEFWRGFLTNQITSLGASGAVHPLCNDPELFVFQCVTDALLARTEIDRDAEVIVVIKLIFTRAAL